MIDRTNHESAAEVFKFLFPDSAIRNLCAAEMAESVRAAHSGAPNGWGITLFTDVVRLNVGRIEVLAYFADRVHCIIDSQQVPTALRERQDVELILDPGGVLVSVPVSGVCNFPAELAAEIFPLLRPFHESLIRAACRGPLNSAARRAYSPGVTDFLSASTGRRLEHPSYYGTTVPLGTTMSALGDESWSAKSSYLLTWNPKRWPWETLQDDVSKLRKKGFVDIRWSCGRTRRIQNGDRIFMLRQGVTPRGIFASGHATGEAFEDSHFDANRTGDTAIYVDVRLDTLLDAENDTIFERAELEKGNLAEVHWDTQMSGIFIPAQSAAQLEAVWSAFLSVHGQEPVFLPDEVSVPAQFFEGATRQVTVSIYERCPFARQRCIEHYGCRCSVCGFDFEADFGVLGRGFIHVHHLKPLADIRAEYEIDPISDLRPICPNCHAMIHRNSPPLTIEDLKQRLRERASIAVSPT